MTGYRVVPVADLAKKQNSYPKIDWPVDRLAVGEALIVPLADGHDPDGRPEKYLRCLAEKAAQRLGRKFSCNKVQDGLAVSRIA